MKRILPCRTCEDYDHGQCRVGICAAVRCLMIAQGWPLPPDRVHAASPTFRRRPETARRRR